MIRDHRITWTVDERTWRLVCGTCGRPVSTVAFTKRQSTAKAILGIEPEIVSFFTHGKPDPA